jgi:VWFA-related protein
VEVSVIALDRHGQPVRGLWRDDFEVFDEGTPQLVRAFSVEEALAPAAAPGQPAVTPVSYSNRQPAPATGSLSVVLFDELNTRIYDKLFARERILTFLDQLQPADRVAIYLLSDRLRILHDFSSDGAALRRALARQTGTAARRIENATTETDSTGDAALDGFLERTSRRIENDAIRDRVRRTLLAVELIARQLGGIPGRKNLIWVSGGFPLTLGMEPRPAGETDFRDQDLFTSEVARAARAVNAANIAIYPIDARGLFTDPQDDGEFRSTEPYFISRRNPQPAGEGANQSQAREAPGGGSGAGGGNSPGPATSRPRAPRLPPPPATQALRRMDATIDSMVLLAQQTGGRAFYNSSDIASALRATLDESTVTYRLAFEPAHNQWDGRFRRIRVKVRRPGVQLRHRQGYLAQAEPALTAAEGLRLLRDATASPLQLHHVALTAALTPAAHDSELHMRLLVSTTDITLHRENELWCGTVDLYLAVTGSAGELLWSDGRRVNFELQPALYLAAGKSGLPLAKTIPWPAGAEHLRIALRDVPTGILGSLRTPLPPRAAPPSASRPESKQL